MGTSRVAVEQECSANELVTDDILLHLAVVTWPGSTDDFVFLCIHLGAGLQFLKPEEENCCCQRCPCYSQNLSSTTSAPSPCGTEGFLLFSFLSIESREERMMLPLGAATQ